MRAVILSGPNQFAPAEIAKPEIGRDEILLEMKAAIAPELDFIFGDIPFTGIDLPLSKFDCSQTEADTGFRAEISFAEGCKRTMEWWKEQEI